MDPRLKKEAVLELARRYRESLPLFQPQPQQLPIFKSKARRLLIRGGNRSGKTLCGAVRVASWVTGQKFRYWHHRKPNIKVLCVSLDFTLMSENIYRKLFEPGAFQVCKKCNRVRHLCDSTRGGDGRCDVDGSTWNDRAREAEPLIPSRFLDDSKARGGIAWLDKSRGVPAKAWLTTGAVFDFKSTDQGRAKFQGPLWDLFWADEEATNDEEIMNEIERGLVDREGHGQISATPLAASLTLVRWSENAGKEAAERVLLEDEGEKPKSVYYEEVQLFSDDNLALAPGALDKFFEDMSEDEIAVRRRGEFLVYQGLVYGSEYDEKVHTIEPFVIPEEWTIYEIQDPGHANAFAVLYWAVDPTGRNYLFDELYLKRQDIQAVVKAQKALLAGGSRCLPTPRRLQRSYIDPAAKQTGIGMSKGKTILQLIHEERRKQDHSAYEGGWGCYLANNEVQAGIFAVKALLRPRTNGEPRLFVMSHLIHFHRERKRYRWPRPPSDKDLVERQGPIKKHDHLMDDWRYGAMARLEYVPPEERPHWGVNPKLREGFEEFLRYKRKSRKSKRADRMALR